MPSSDELNRNAYLHGEIELDTAVVNDTQYVRDPAGVWRYVDNWIKVPGARDLTLTERFQPKLILAADHEVERVIVSIHDITAHPELLGWCREMGTPVTGADGMVQEVIVPFEAWHEQDRIPGEIVAPEHSDDPGERELAFAEREYREADRALEVAAARRAEVLRRYSDEMTRQHARAITDLSVGRIQQLIREGVDDLDDVDQLLLSLVQEKHPKSAKTLGKLAASASGITFPTVMIQQRLHGYVERGLVIQSGQKFALSPEGERVFRALRESREAGDDQE